MDIKKGRPGCSGFALAILIALQLVGSVESKAQVKTVAIDTAANFADFITKIDKKNATKDGIYLNGYVVEISYEEIKRLHGKRVRVRGKVVFVRGLKHSGTDQERQGRQEDYRKISNPVIVVVSPVSK